MAQPHQPADQPRIELVVARYRENLNWLRNVPDSLRVTVYDKAEEGSEASWPGAIRLPNLGREAHTYLYHLIHRYDSLVEWTVFCQGKPFDHAYDFHQQLRSFAADPEAMGPFRWLGHIIDTDDYQGGRLFQRWSKNEDQRSLDLTGFHQALWGETGPPSYTFVLGAQFAVHREVIRRQSPDFYQKALILTTDFPDGAHCFERVWDRVFGQIGIDPDWLAGRETVYLKPIRRLGDGA